MTNSDDNQWIVSVYDNLFGSFNNNPPQKWSVCRVPSYIRRMKSDRYDFRVLGLGAYNRIFTSPVTPMDMVKLEVVRVFLKRRKLVDRDGWRTFCSEISAPRTGDPSLEDFYDDPPITAEVLESVVTVDAVFVTAFCVVRWNLGELQGTPFYKELQEIIDRSDVRVRAEEFGFDLWLLENQIPLFFIRNVLEQITKRCDDVLRSIVYGIVMFCGLPHSQPTNGVSDSNPPDFRSCTHLLQCFYKVVCGDTCSNELTKTGYLANGVGKLSELLRTCPIPMGQFLIQIFGKERREMFISLPKVRRTLPTVSQLQQAGIYVRGNRTIAREIKFVKSFFNLQATLYLPKIDLNNSSERCLINMCVYELMSASHENKFLCAYVQLMDDLVNTGEDVKLLRQGDEPVITGNLMGSDKILADTIFHNPLKNIARDKSDFSHLETVEEEIHTWYGTRWRHQLTHLIDRFLTAPWISITLIVATLLLISTILQTVYTVMGHYHK